MGSRMNSEMKGSSATQSIPRWLCVLAVLAVACGLLAWLANLSGVRSFFFAFQLHFVLMAAATFIDQLLAPELSSERFRVRPGELAFYRRIGVTGFMRLLQKIRWTPRGRRSWTQATLSAYEKTTRHGENCHIWLFIAVLFPIAWVAFQGWWDAVLWLGSMNIFFHAYPTFLQRMQRARLQRLLERRGLQSSANLSANL